MGLHIFNNNVLIYFVLRGRGDAPTMHAGLIDTGDCKAAETL